MALLCVEGTVSLFEGLLCDAQSSRGKSFAIASLLAIAVWARIGWGKSLAERQHQDHGDRARAERKPTLSLLSHLYAVSLSNSNDDSRSRQILVVVRA
jgi:hypothetical protein